MPLLLGHENVAVVEDVGPKVDPVWKGRRVCVEPTLSCIPRGIDPTCARCREGEFGACENFADNRRGSAQLPPGTSIGYNNRTGGTYGQYFVAHDSQLIGVPDDIPDEVAVLTDCLACSLHAVLRADVSHAQSVLVYGAGAVGLALVAILRAVGYSGRIDLLSRHSYPIELAAACGADNFLHLGRNSRERSRRIAQETGASLQRARFGNVIISGGYDIAFDCVGSVQSLNETLKWTRARGQAIIVGTGHGTGVDLTPIWFRELTVIGAYGRQIESFRGRKLTSYQIVHEFISQRRLPQIDRLLTHTFGLDQYRRAFDVALNKSRHHAFKVAFDLR